MNKKLHIVTNTRGIFMMEILVAMSLFGILAASLVPSFIFHLQTNTNSEIRSQAIRAAEFVLDERRRWQPENFPESGTTSTGVVIDSRSFEVTVTYCSNTSYCSDTVKHLLVKVFYKSQQYYEVETVYAKILYM